MDLAGHQMASHTWSHANLSSLTEASRRSEMYKLEMAMRNIVGKFPTYMRPPYSACDDACVATMAALGYHVTYFDLDTDDYNNETPALIQNAKNNFYNAINPSNPTTDAFLAIAHDIHEQTALNLTDYMLTTLTAKGYRAVTVGECLGDPSINWYRSSTPGATTTPTDATTTTTASNPTTTPTTSCAATAGAWCAAPLSTYTTISGCWTATDQCWTQGSTCWATVSGELGPQCGTYQGICKLVEAHCTSCVAAVGDGEGPCENYVSGV